jgi:cytochrome P450
LTTRAITRNEELYPEPERFNPERFIGKMESEAANQVDAIFGFGRRVCPGKAFAEANVWLLMANIVATMNIEKSVDEMGQPITPNPEYIGSYVRYEHPDLASGISAFLL